jgi:hypothetical protein
MFTLVLTINPAFLRAKGRLLWVFFYAWHGLGMLLVAVLAASSLARYRPPAKRAGLWKNTGKPGGRLGVVTVSEITKHTG